MGTSSSEGAALDEPGAPQLLAQPDAEGRSWVESTLAALSLPEAVAQLVFQWIPGGYAAAGSPDLAELEWLVDQGVGGVAISIGLPHSYVAKLNALQDRARIPLLVTSDFENGGPGMRINHAYALPSLLGQGGGTSFPPTMAFGAVGDERAAYEYGRITAIEARAVGVHLNFAPVLDVNSNPENPIINTRSFGEDPRQVARLGRAYIRGARAGGVMTTAKHFPGHGDTRTDSHLALPQVTADRARLDSLELIPFQAAVDEGVDAVMTAHVSVPAILGPDGPPATLAPEFMTQLLRNEMGFEGLLFTDALRMGAIANGFGVGESAVLALEAGADVVLAPADVPQSVDAIIAAVEAGRVSRQRIDASVRRILEMKARVGLHRARAVDLAGVDRIVGSGEHLAFADSVATRSITLPRDEAGLVPVDPRRTPRILSVTYSRSRDLVAGLAFNEAARAYAPALTSARVDSRSGPEDYDRLFVRSQDADLLVIGAYVPPSAGVGSVAVPADLIQFVENVSRSRPTVLVSFGSPYLLSALPSVGSYMVAWGDHEVSQRAAARALFGEEAVSGRLPISIPPLHALGDGLRREAVARMAGLSRAGRRDPLSAAGILPARGGGEAELGLWGPWGPRGPRIAVPPGEATDAQAVSVEVDPATVGMTSVGLARVDSIIEAAVADSASPGVVLAVGRHGRIVRMRGYGRLDWDPSAPEATPSSIYDMASLTKVIATTTAAQMLADEGALDLDAAVVQTLPWWDDGDAQKATVTVRQLLLHRAGLPPFRRWFQEISGREAYEQAIGALELAYPPGDSTVYSDIGLMTVGFIVEAVSGLALDDFLQQRVLAPLGMQDSGFRPDPALRSRIAPTEVDTTYRNTHVHGVVHDENAYAMGGVAGHAGLFSSARDLAVFAQMLLSGGSLDGCSSADRESGVPCSAARSGTVRLLQAATVDRFTRRHDESSSRAEGWDTPTARSSSGRYLSDRAYGHTGYTGPSVWIDPELDLFVVLLTNRVNPTRENTKHIPLRRAVHDGIVKSIADRAIAPAREETPS